MANTSENLLIQAKEHFYALRLLESYAIFRRFFDRIPFQPEKRHAEYIGMFARLLAELGKTSELKFYMGELERWQSKLHDPSIAYQLAIVYSYLPEPRIESARRIFEQLLKDPNAADYRLKARMMLADYYDNKNDLGACRQLIFGVDLNDVDDPVLNLMYQVWRGKILSDENQHDEAMKIVTSVLEQVSVETNWYLYWWCKVILARTYFRVKRKKDAQRIITEVKEFLKIRRCRSLENHLSWLQQFDDLVSQARTAATTKSRTIRGEL
ncbi:MAG: hypothetical protein HYR96_02385 [Deltaproteobacteria bacterium]|nr:hypothetical protein [Deltaproteobacteria bacterium]MBI3293156.1 hypothetical protein [Deltaproteobacteria bacterium]